MYNFYNSISEQENRIEYICDLFCKCSREYINENGEWLIKQPHIRERLWAVHSLIENGNESDIKRAQKIMETFDVDSFGPFECLSAVELFLDHKEVLSEKTTDFLNRVIHNSRSHLLDSEMDFCGVNDNFPFMGIGVLAGLYKLYREDVIYNKLVERIVQIEEILTRRGTVTEYSSPTYAAFQVRSVALACEYMKDMKIGDLETRLLNIEHRLWFDVFSRYFPASCNLAGPYTRTSTIDSMGHTNTARGMFYAILGDTMQCSIIDTSFVLHQDVPEEVCSGNWPWYIQIVLSEMINAIYHCPEYIVNLMKNRQYPYWFQTTSDFANNNDVGHEIHSVTLDTYLNTPLEKLCDYPCEQSVASIYMTEKYSLGVATREFHNGVQTDLFHLTYVKPGDENINTRIKTLYSRYVTNDAHPDVKEGLLKDGGRKIGLQSKNSALVLYRPKFLNTNGIYKAGLSLCLHTSWNMVEEIWLGETKVTAYNEKISNIEPIFIKDGDIYVCITPVINSSKVCEYAIDVQKYGGFVTINLYNYVGQKRNFSEKEMMLLGNGFGIEVRDRQDFGSFEKFRKEYSTPTVSDTYIYNEHTRNTYMREISYQNNGDCFEIEYSPVTEGIKYATINGREQIVDRIIIDGFDCGVLPFMS